MFGVLVPIFAMFIPIVAIIGGITAGIFRMRAQQKVAELAMQERIAAIGKGIDPRTLPPPPTVMDPREVHTLTPRERALELAQGLQIGALVTGATGIGLGLFFLVVAGNSLWIIGVGVAIIGLALWISANIVRTNAGPATAPGPTVAP
jgi:hypothetical protein